LRISTRAAEAMDLLARIPHEKVRTATHGKPLTLT
jgi:hypothetical protein